MRVGGSNRDTDVARCLEDQGANVETLHLNDILRRRNLSSYNGLVLPGGFAYGDYVRAGAIWAGKIQAHLKEDVRMFVEARKPILGICNGFQVLIELGLLPEMTLSKPPLATLANNSSGKFECRWVTLKKNPRSNCIFTRELPDIVKFPVAHGEGRFFVGDAQNMEKILANNQVALQYATPQGHPANLSYPENPNGSEYDIAGLSSESGTVFGLMPHPENAYWGFEMPEWTVERTLQPRGDGVGVFKSMVDYIEKTF
jgi:phosphoribosylformylglycinamidine synthase I